MACWGNRHVCPIHELVLQSQLGPLKAAAGKESLRVTLRPKRSHQAQDPQFLLGSSPEEPPSQFKLSQDLGLASTATPTQKPPSAHPKGCTHLGRASLLFMYSLYSSWVSKSQRPRGPFLLPCSKRMTQSSSLADTSQGFSHAQETPQSPIDPSSMGLCTQSGLASKIPSLRSPRQILWKSEFRWNRTPPQYLFVKCHVCSLG